MASTKPKNINQQQQQSKFEYLKGKYIFRFPFTMTSLKWATIMGAFFSAHAFLKKRTIKAAVEWGLWGTVLSVFPIWFFFMTKYTLYSHSIKKFQTQQLAEAEDSQLRKKLLQISADSDEQTQEKLFKVLDEKITKQILRDRELDFLLQDVDSNWLKQKLI